MVIRDLGDGLVLRRATAADVEAPTAFNAEVFRNEGAAEPNEPIAIWTRDLMQGRLPTFQVGDFTVVEDTHRGAIVSSLNLISQTWSYTGVWFGVGRVELVGTDPAYRRRGLVRAQFDVVHQWSADRGELVQAITGIPWYYRQFGYEYALALDGARGGSVTDLPPPLDPSAEPYRIRPATADDVPFIGELDEHVRRRYLVTAVRDAALWRYEIEGRSKGSVDRTVYQIVETTAGEPVGYLGHYSALVGGALIVDAAELRAGVPWPAVAPSVLRYLRVAGERLATLPRAGSFTTVTVRLEPEHPLFQSAREHLPRVIAPYSWYIRVPDVAALIRRITPVLESRLAASPAAGYSGELRLCFFRDGLQMDWQGGRLASVLPWPEANYDACSVSFPDLAFLQLLFGYRSLAELRHTFPDCIARNDDARLLLEVLFPAQPSQVRGVF